MFENALEKLKKTLSSGSDTVPISKSNLPSGDGEGEGNASPEIGELASEAVVLFESGELEPSAEAVAEWARSKGLPDEGIDEFTSAVLDSYFADGGGEPGVDGDDPGLADPGNGEPGEGLEEIKKSILALTASQSILAEGMDRLLSREGKVSNLEKEIKVLKSSLSKLVGTPAGNKSPVMVTDNPVGSVAAPNQSQAKEFELLILKGIQAGKLPLEEMTYFESTGKLSADALAYVNLEKEVKK